MKGQRVKFKIDEITYISEVFDIHTVAGQVPHKLNPKQAQVILVSFLLVNVKDKLVWVPMGECEIVPDSEPGWNRRPD